MEDKVPMTKDGYESLMKELKRLKGVERPGVLNEIAVAREHGDISENAEYEAAKDKHYLLEKKIRQIEHKLARAEVIDVSIIDNEKIVFGATVHIRDENDEKVVSYQIVGSDEADARKGKISVNSPLARALIGKEVDDTVEAKLPNDVKEYTILKID